MTLSPTAAFMLGLDGFVVCVALGPLHFGFARTCLLATMFGLCDALAMLSGAVYPLQGVWPSLVPGIIIACLLFVFLFPGRARTLAFVLPVPLALDNFLVGTWNGLASPLADVVGAGAVSASLALLGLCLSATLARRTAAFRGPLRAAFLVAAISLLVLH